MSPSIIVPSRFVGLAMGTQAGCLSSCEYAGWSSSLSALSIPRIAIHEGEKSGATLAPGATFQIHRIEQPHWSIPLFVTAAPDASSTTVTAIGPYFMIVTAANE